MKLKLKYIISKTKIRQTEKMSGTVNADDQVNDR